MIARNPSGSVVQALSLPLLHKLCQLGLLLGLGNAELQAVMKAVNRWQHSQLSAASPPPITSLRDARSRSVYYPEEFLISWSLSLVKYNTDFKLIHFKYQAI